MYRPINTLSMAEAPTQAPSDVSASDRSETGEARSDTINDRKRPSSARAESETYMLELCIPSRKGRVSEAGNGVWYATDRIIMHDCFGKNSGWPISNLDGLNGRSASALIWDKISCARNNILALLPCESGIQEVDLSAWSVPLSRLDGGTRTLTIAESKYTPESRLPIERIKDVIGCFDGMLSWLEALLAASNARPDGIWHVTDVSYLHILLDTPTLFSSIVDNLDVVAEPTEKKAKTDTSK